MMFQTKSQQTVFNFMTGYKNVQMANMDDPLIEAVDKMEEHNIKKLLVQDAGKYYVLELFKIRPEDIDADKRVRDIPLNEAPVTESGRSIADVYPMLNDNPLVVVKDGENLEGVVTMTDYLRKRKYI
jgi:predicted transcriptional regulator